ncbi:MAG: 4-hydroxy-tetrahydrodipicolinate synthase [Chloroflexi bacterium]|nr:4-hydroxy-tetrahydrodipicolinate synthase [Chloroflexota bacterium]MCI0783363.1 4-hydroxy-tetrahydrodipicolinate synthase [Chloroflexota bacterium]MCI0818570.1 4-hydroxy-tetrahydrodipicolinate synthase [Chloroflexota bacterium]
MELGRVLTAMATPFDREGQVDYGQAKRLSLALLDAGSDGLVVAGTTGEAPTLSHDEKLALFREVKAAVGDRGAVIAGTGTNNTAASIELSREAEAIGVDALLLTAPYYSRPPQEGLFRHFQAIAAATSLPCILYNIPSRTAVNVTAATQLRLAEIPNIAGVKEASGDLDQIAEIIEGAHDFLVWSGDDQMALPIVAIGGYGVVGVATHLVGLQMRAMIEAQLDGRGSEAATIHRRLLPLMKTLMTAAPNPIPLKYALNHVGFQVGGLRLPLIEADAAVAESVVAELSRHQIDLAVAV